MIIIPDVHGRTFWKECVKDRENEDIIFLGDYLDPYPQEGISKDEALSNFKELIAFANEHKNNVTLLLGNHDFMVYLSREMGSCRSDFSNAAEISSIFHDNFDLFKIADIRTIGETKYIFSHAPLLYKWVEDCQEDHFGIPPLFSKDNDKTIEDIVYKLNWSLKHNFEGLCVALNKVSWYRGGYQDFGSVVWSDISEIDFQNKPEFEGCYEIFGHTQLRELPIIGKYAADLDCRQGFILDNEGKITQVEYGMDSSK